LEDNILCTKQEEILSRILKCGYSDISLLDNIGFDIDNIMDELVNDNKLSLENIISRVFEIGIKDLSADISRSRTDIIEQLKEAISSFPDDFDEESFDDMDDLMFDFIYSHELESKVDAEKDFEILERLSPQNDISIYFNFLDTKISFKDFEYADVYKRYFSREVDQFVNNTGFNISGY
jgi:hypothetical protein